MLARQIWVVGQRDLGILRAPHDEQIGLADMKDPPARRTGGHFDVDFHARSAPCDLMNGLSFAPQPIQESNNRIERTRAPLKRANRDVAGATDLNVLIQI